MFGIEFVLAEAIDALHGVTSLKKRGDAATMPVLAWGMVRVGDKDRHNSRSFCLHRRRVVRLLATSLSPPIRVM